MSGFRLFDLNPEQEAAVKCTEGPMLILAGAGTGKTRVITTRIAYLIDSGVSPDKILAVTFTNKAAREMKERIAGLVPAEVAERVTASTFHSLCVRILRIHGEKLGYKKNFSIFDESDQMGLLRKVITRTASKDEKLDPNVARALISRAKNQGWNAPPEEETLLGAVYARYQAELKQQNAMDFDDLLGQAVRLLDEHEDVRAYWRSRFAHLLVDEFQDTNKLQLDLVSLLCQGERPNICVVGDDDQSIYGWRGAEISNILEFERHFPRPAIFKLEQNYRSTNAILGAANRLIQNNRQRRSKKLWSAGQDGTPIRVMALPDEATEAEFVAGEIAAQRAGGNLPWEDFAVLFRMNAQSRLLEGELRRLRIPYRVVGGKSFFDRREVKDLLAYLAAVVNPSDDQAFLRVVNTPPRGIGVKAVELALDDSVENRRSVQETLADPAFQSRFTRKTAAAMADFLGQLQTLRIRCATPGADLAGLIGAFLEECGYPDDLQRSCKTPEEFLNRESNLKEMLSTLGNYAKRAQGGLQGFLDEMNLDRDREEDKAEDARGVTLITLHAAKGLEFPHVYLIGVEDGLLPHSRSLAEGTLDEERRLFYVGITRARQTLNLSWCRKRSRYGSSLACAPSRFLEEIEGEGVEVVDYEEFLAAEPEEDYAEAQFALLRGMMEDS
jgi:superfamily I DNA/RNA helicase